MMLLSTTPSSSARPPGRGTNTGSQVAPPASCHTLRRDERGSCGWEGASMDVQRCPGRLLGSLPAAQHQLPQNAGGPPGPGSLFITRVIKL